MNKIVLMHDAIFNITVSSTFRITTDSEHNTQAEEQFTGSQIADVTIPLKQSIGIQTDASTFHDPETCPRSEEVRKLTESNDKLRSEMKVRKDFMFKVRQCYSRESTAETDLMC